MGVDKSDVLKKMREAEAIYVLMSDCTRMPFVVCDPETYDDQVLIFFSEEEAMKGGQEFLKEGTGQKTGAETGRGTDRESEFPDYSYVLHAEST